MIADCRLLILLDIVTVFIGRPRIHTLPKLIFLAWTSPTLTTFPSGMTTQISNPNCISVENVGRLWETLSCSTRFVNKQGARGHKWSKSFPLFGVVLGAGLGHGSSDSGVQTWEGLSICDRLTTPKKRKAVLLLLTVLPIADLFLQPQPTPRTARNVCRNCRDVWCTSE